MPLALAQCVTRELATITVCHIVTGPLYRAMRSSRIAILTDSHEHHKYQKLYKYRYVLVVQIVLCILLFVLGNFFETYELGRSAASPDTLDLRTGSLSAKWNGANPSPASPWMTPPCRKLIEGVIEMVGGAHASVLEFGLGGSTLHFARLVGSYYAIESDADFFSDVTRSTRFHENTKTVLCQRGKYVHENDVNTLQKHPRWGLMNKTMSGKPKLHTSRVDGFESYVLQASRFDRSMFDFILIDGMARAATAFYVLDLISENSRVAIHDFWTDAPNNWLICDLLKYYRIDATINSQMPYQSGGAVVILQKRRRMGERYTHTHYGDIVDDALQNFAHCVSSSDA